MVFLTWHILEVFSNMKLLKYIIAIGLPVGAYLLCIWLTGILPADHWGFAISVNFLLMIIFTVIFDHLFPPVFLKKYFSPKPFEREGTIYLWVGIRYFKKLLKLIGWEKIIRKGQVIKNQPAILGLATPITPKVENQFEHLLQ
jgi:hypothetical protein